MNQYLTFGGVENLNPGVGGVQSRTLPRRFTTSLMGLRSPAATGARSSGSGNPRPHVNGGGGMDEDELDGLGGNPLIVWAGLALLLVLAWFVRNQQDTLQVNLLGINAFNLLVITITAILGITLFKMVFLKLPVPGLSQVVAAV